jgi:serine protease Do
MISIRRVRSLLAALLASCGLIAPSHAQDSGASSAHPTEPPAVRSAESAGATSSEDIAFAKRLSKAFKSVASTVEPSVIHITALVKQQQVRYDFFGRPIARGTPTLQPMSLGSGVIVSSAGYAVTNNHVVKGADALKVKFFDGREVDAKLVGRDDLTDLAVIKIEQGDAAQPLAAAEFADSEDLEVGEWVVAIGSPFGLSNTVTAGIVSAKGRSVTPRETGRTQEDFIQTDAAINPGNSGGPLLNLQGRIVGINSAIASRTGGYEGIGFAIPGNTARTVMENIIANGRVVRGWIGVALEDAKPAQVAGHSQGVAVTQVVRESPAEQAGLQVGDVILKFKGAAMNEPRLRQAIAISPPGSKADLEVLRDGKVKALTVAMADQAAANGEVRVDVIGMTVRTLTPQQSRRLGFRNVTGVMVVSVDDAGRAAKATPSPFQEGDIIVGLKDETVKDADGFARLAESCDYNRGVAFMVIRDTERGQLIIRD